jgi:glycosyltransferase involved in cell wall biosynthesis
VHAAQLAEKTILEHADVAIALSIEDQSALANVCADPPPFVLLPNVHPALEPPTGPTGRAGLLFVGGYEHDPNVDGAAWFVIEVLPLIVSEVGEVHVTLAGSKPTDEVLALRSDSIAVPGWLEDLGPLYDQARVAIAPLRFGAGVKGKVGEALARGVPMVATTVGAEGMGLRSGDDIEVADDPAAFAARVVRLLRDDQHWHRLSEGGRAAIDRSMGLGATQLAVASLLETVSKVGRAPRGGNGG